jgi:hypothetical protein
MVDEGRWFKATLLFAVLLPATLVTVSPAGGQEDRAVGLTPAQETQIIEGARELAGLDEEEISRVLEDPEFVNDIPVDVRFSVSETEPTNTAASSDGYRTQAAYETTCREKLATVEYVDADKKPLFRFDVTKKWCFNGERVLSGNMNEVETWVRADARYSPETGGWRYNKAAEAGTDEFRTFHNRPNGAHRSSRAGKFEYFFPNASKPAGGNSPGVMQSGRYNGTCFSDLYEPIAEPTINSGPSGVVRNTSARFTFSAEGSGTTFKCSLDGRGFKGCTSPKSYSSLKEGRHTFRIMAVDSVGNATTKPPARVWVLDTTAPQVIGVRPVAGAEGVAPGANIIATFSEDVEAVSLIGNFTLVRKGNGARVGAALSYDPANNRAVLNPNSNLAAGATYTARVRGGSGGVTDRAGNPLASDKVWSFTVAR